MPLSYTAGGFYWICLLECAKEAHAVSPHFEQLIYFGLGVRQCEMLYSSDCWNSFGALLQEDHRSPLVTKIPYGSSLFLLMVFHLQYSSKVSEEIMGAGTILGMRLF